MGKTESLNTVISATMAEKLKARTAAVTNRRPKMAEERRARISALKGRKVENVPGQDVDDYLALTDDMDSREELVGRYYTPAMKNCGSTMAKQLEEEIKNHRREKEADEKELKALFEDYGGRDTVLEAVCRRRELRGNISTFLENVKKHPLDNTSPMEIAALVKEAVEKGIIEEGPGPVVWSGKSYNPRVEDDAAIAEFIKIFVPFLNGWKEESDKLAASRRDKAAAHVLERDELQTLRKNSLEFREFLDSNHADACCFLEVYGRDRYQENEKFLAGEVCLEKDGATNVCRRVTTLRLARMLFFYTRKGELCEEKEYRFTGYDTFSVRSALLRETFEVELKKAETAEDRRRRAFGEAVAEFKAKVIDGQCADLFFSLEKGEDGTYAMQGTFGKDKVPVAYIIERRGRDIKVRWALPGDSTKILYGSGGKLFDLIRLPHPNRFQKRPVTPRSILRALYQSVTGITEIDGVPEHLRPFVRNSDTGAGSAKEEGEETMDTEQETRHE